MKVWPVKHSPLLCQSERFIARSELQALIRNVTQNLVNIKDENGQFLLRLDDERVINIRGRASWEWTRGVGLYGIYQHYQQTGDIETRDIIDRWFADCFTEGATTKSTNTMAPFLTPAYRFEKTGRMAYPSWLKSWAEWAMHEMPRTEQGGMQHMILAEENHRQMWDDMLMMTVLPLAKTGKLLNRLQYVEEVIYQLLFHMQNLVDRETGLWFHGWNYEEWHNLARACWVRDNSWLIMVILDFLELVDPPEGNTVRRYLMMALDAQIAALAKCQDDNGLWHTLLDDPYSHPGVSVTAGFACGILKAVHKRHVEQHYAGAVEKATRGIVCNVSPQGELLQVSFGIGMGADLDSYRQILLTSIPYGQAMAILCLTGYLCKYF